MSPSRTGEVSPAVFCVCICFAFAETFVLPGELNVAEWARFLWIYASEMRATDEMHSRCSKIPFRNRFQIVQCLIGMENWITDDKIVCFTITKHQQILLYLDSGFITTLRPPPATPKHFYWGRYIGTVVLRQSKNRTHHDSDSSLFSFFVLMYADLLCAPFISLGTWKGNGMAFKCSYFSSPTTIGSEIAPRKPTSLPLKQIKTPKFR